LELLEWNYINHEIPEPLEEDIEGEFDWEEVDDHLKEMVLSLAELCEKLTRVSFCLTMPESVNTLDIVRGGDGGYEVIPLGYSDDTFSTQMCTSTWKGVSDMYGDL